MKKVAGKYDYALWSKLPRQESEINLTREFQLMMALFSFELSLLVKIIQSHFNISHVGMEGLKCFSTLIFSFGDAPYQRYKKCIM